MKTHGIARRRLGLEPLERRDLLASSAGLLPEMPHALDRVLVRFHDDYTSSQVTDALGGSSVRRLGSGGFYSLQLESSEQVANAIARLKNLAQVEYVQPDYLLSAAAVYPNDPYFPSQYALNNIGQSGGTADADMDAPEAWAKITGSSSVVVAVLDTGVDYNHADLAGNIWANTDEVPGNGVDDDGNGYVDDVRGWNFVENNNAPMDDDFHGTHMAGIIGAVGNNGIGVSGVAWDVSLMPLRFLDSTGHGYTSDAIAALDYARLNGAKIVNASWGGEGSSQLLSDAIERFHQAGGILVAAAGNDSIGHNIDQIPQYPASYAHDNIIAVASSDRNDQLASSSNYGVQTVDLAAPGVSILSTMPQGGYAYGSGTSMATAQVSGAAAVIWSEHPEYSYTQVISALLDNTDPVLLNRVAHGRLNLDAALDSDGGGGGGGGGTGEVLILDDGQSGYSTTSGWIYYTGVGLNSDLDYIAAGSGSDIASWTFAVSAPGTYRVSSTWYPHTNRASDAPYRVYNGSATGNNLLGTVRLNQRVSPDDLSDAGASWEHVGEFTVTGNTLTVTLANDANGYLIADAIRIESIDGTPAPSGSPEIEVRDAGLNIPDNIGQIAFGTTNVGSPLSHVLTVTNTGDEALTLQTPISVPNGYAVTGFGLTTLQPSQATTFTVTLTAGAAGSYSGPVSFGNNDADENPFNFTVSGTVQTPSPPPTGGETQIIDDGDAGYSTSGSWTPYSGLGHEGDLDWTAKGNGSSVASWTFAVPAAGSYQVSTTWLTHSNRATDAPYRIYNGSAIPANLLGTVRVNQEVEPNDLTEAGTNWEHLGVFTTTGTTLTVTLANDANEYLIADAVRIESTGGSPPPAGSPEIEVRDAGLDIPDNAGTVDMGATSLGVSLSRVFTVHNTGSEALQLGSSISVQTGYTVTGFSQTTLQPSQSTSFTITLTAATAGAFSGTVSFATNDADENPFNFLISGTVQAPPPGGGATQFVDNGDAGYSTVGSWEPYSGLGYGSDLDWTAKGSGSDIATWTATVSGPGTYRISATWDPHSNRATDAPYRIYNAGTLLATVRMNQELTPDDLNEGGTAWEHLGQFTLIDTTLTVTLSNDANGYILADAIRIESIQGSSGEIVVAAGLDEFESPVVSWQPGRSTERSVRRFQPHNTSAVDRVLQEDPIVGARHAEDIDMLVTVERLQTFARQKFREVIFARFDPFSELLSSGLW